MVRKKQLTENSIPPEGEQPHRNYRTRPLSFAPRVVIHRIGARVVVSEDDGVQGCPSKDLMLDHRCKSRGSHLLSQEEWVSTKSDIIRTHLLMEIIIERLQVTYHDDLAFAVFIDLRPKVQVVVSY